MSRTRLIGLLLLALAMRAMTAAGQETAARSLHADSQVTGNFSQLDRLVSDRTDDQIESAAESIGIDKLLDQVFGTMVATFDAQRAGSESGVVQYSLRAPKRIYTYQVVINHGHCSFRKGSATEPRTLFELTLPNFLRLADGKLSGLRAFLTGRLTIRGDSVFALKQERWFTRP